MISGKIFSVDSEMKSYFKVLRGKDSSSLARKACSEIVRDKYDLLNNSENLEVSEHHHLTRHPEILVSFAHTEDLALSFVLSQYDQPEVASIGVDVELINREIPEILLQKYLRPEDVFSTPLCAWVQKEAAYKAIQPIYKGCRDLRDIIIINDHFFLAEKPEIKGFYSFRNDFETIIAFAYVVS